MNSRKRGPYALFFMRMLDIVCSLTVIFLLSLLYVIVAVLVRVMLGSPVIFKQERPGRIDPKTGKERIFCLYKFRTMTDARDVRGEPLPDEQRLTPFGAWLRRTSLDEIPEAFNILKGDMSLIGPRPLLVRYLPRYNEEQRHRHDVRPGLTGYAQAHGRNGVSWEDKFAMDVWYTKHITFVGDMKILLDTLRAVWKKEGISSGSSVTMEEFMGTPEGVVAEWKAPY